jgi:hypothetical protein
MIVNSDGRKHSIAHPLQVQEGAISAGVGVGMDPPHDRPRAPTSANAASLVRSLGGVGQSPLPRAAPSAPLPPALLANIQRESRAHALATSSANAEAEAHRQLHDELDAEHARVQTDIRRYSSTSSPGGGGDGSVVPRTASGSIDLDALMALEAESAATVYAPAPAPAAPLAAAEDGSSGSGSSLSSVVVGLPASAPYGFHFYTPPSMNTSSIGSASQLQRAQTAGRFTPLTMIDRFNVDTSWVPITTVADFAPLLATTTGTGTAAAPPPAPPAAPPPALSATDSGNDASKSTRTRTRTRTHTNTSTNNSRDVAKATDGGPAGLAAQYYSSSAGSGGVVEQQQQQGSVGDDTEVLVGPRPTMPSASSYNTTPSVRALSGSLPTETTTATIEMEGDEDDDDDDIFDPGDGGSSLAAATMVAALRTSPRTRQVTVGALTRVECYLKKQRPGFRGGWQKRYFVLDGQELT